MPAKILIEYDANDLKELILEDLRGKMPDVDLVLSDIKVEVKSTQNYKLEWETAAFRARVENTKERVDAYSQRSRA